MDGKKKNGLFSALLAGAGFIAIVEIIVMISYRETWVDEFFSAYKGYLILRGELIPFQNGIFDYAPLTIPTYGLIHYFFGPDLYAARILSSILLVGVLALVFSIGRRLGGRWAGLGALLLVLSNLLLVGNYVSATMYAFVMLCLLSVVALETSGLSRRKKTILIAVVTALAILGRTNMTAAAALYAIYLLVIGIPFFELGIFAAVAGVIVALGYVPIVFSNPSVALSFILGPYVSFGPFASLPRPLIAQGFTRFAEVLMEFMREYFGFLALFFAVVGTVVWRESRRLRIFAREEPGYTLLIVFSVGLFAAHYCYWRLGGHVYYANYFMPLMSLVGVIGVVKFFSDNRLASVLLVVVIALNFGVNAYRTDVVSNPRDESDLHRVARGAQFVREHTKPDDKLLTFDNSLYHVFLADRRTFLPLMQRDFLFLSDADTAGVRRLGFYNLAMLKQWASEDADFLLLHKEKWNESFVRRPMWGKGTEDTERQMQEIRMIFEQKYELAGSVLNVYPRKYTEGNDGGTLELYRRKKDAAPKKKYN